MAVSFYVLQVWASLMDAPKEQKPYTLQGQAGKKPMPRPHAIRHVKRVTPRQWAESAGKSACRSQQ